MNSPKEIENWNRFVREGLLEEADPVTGMDTRYPFPKMSKLFGREYMEYLQFQYACYLITERYISNGVGVDPWYESFDDWRNYHGGVPEGFVSKLEKMVDKLYALDYGSLMLLDDNTRDGAVPFREYLDSLR